MDMNQNNIHKKSAKTEHTQGADTEYPLPTAASVLGSGPVSGSGPQSGPVSAPAPAPAPDSRDLPHALTFFMTGCERLQILRALRRLDGNRVFALKRALGLA